MRSRVSECDMSLNKDVVSLVKNILNLYDIHQEIVVIKWNKNLYFSKYILTQNDPDDSMKIYYMYVHNTLRTKLGEYLPRIHTVN